MTTKLTELLSAQAGLSGLPEAYEFDYDGTLGRSFRRKLRKLIKKAAVVGAVVAGAMFLGPVVVPMIKGVAAKMAIGKVVAGKVIEAKLAPKQEPGSVIVEQPATAGEPPTVVTDSNFRNALDSALGLVNSAMVIEAIQRGEVPPPPVSLQGDSFTQWATSIGSLVAQREAQRKLSAAEQAALASEVSRVQTAAVSYPPPPHVVYSPMPQVPIEVQKVQEASFLSGQNMNMLMLGGIGLIAVMMLLGPRR